MFCEKCGYKLREDGCFCENCGTKFSKFDSEEKEIYNNNYKFFYKINRIKNLPKIFITAYIIEFIAIIIACIFPIAYTYSGMCRFCQINFSVKFLILAAIFSILGIVINKKIILHIITVILYFPTFNLGLTYKLGLLRESIIDTIGYDNIDFDTGVTDVYYISSVLILISLTIVIVYEIYRRKANKKNEI